MKIDEVLKNNLIADVENILGQDVSREKEYLKRAFEITIGHHYANLQPIEPKEPRELHFFDNEKGDVSIEVNGEMVGYIKTKFPAEFFNAFTIEVIPQERRECTSIKSKDGKHHAVSSNPEGCYCGNCGEDMEYTNSEQKTKCDNTSQVEKQTIEEIPHWYSKQEMYDWLILHSYSKEIATELSQIWSDDLQGAFQKGWEKAKYELGKNQQPGISVTDEMIKTEAIKLFPTTKPKNYLQEGQWLGFLKGAKWLRDKLKVNLREELIKLLKFIANGDDLHESRELVDNNWYWTSDTDGDCTLTEEEIVDEYLKSKQP